VVLAGEQRGRENIAHGTYGAIYCIRNKVNGKLYIGQTTQPVNTRFSRHATCRRVTISAAIRKYGKENFEVSVLQECSSADELNVAECEQIERLGSLVPNGYNVALGGHISNVTPEAIERRVAPLRGRKRPDEFKEKIRRAMTGRSLTKETKAKLSAARAGKPVTGNAIKNLAQRREKRWSMAGAHLCQSGERNGRAALTWENVAAGSSATTHLL
jgi:group I intron endonuclease